jgi:hypothetical protein
VKCYYAHCMAIYHTPQELRDIELLKCLGFSVINPSCKEVEEIMKTIPTADERMAYFKQFATECECIAFRALPDGSIPSGVAKELDWFREVNKPIFELPSNMLRRVISLEATREYLREVGQR